MSIPPKEPIRNEPDEPGLRKRTKPYLAKERVIWTARTIVGLVLLAAFKIAFDRVSSTYNVGAIPSARIVAFINAIRVFLVCSGPIVIYEYFRPLVSGSRNRFAPYVWLRTLMLGLTAAGALCLLYGFYVEPSWLQVTHVRVENAKLPRGAAPIRLVVISDLHMGRTLNLEPRLPGVIAAQNPDMIFFLGDALNSTWALASFQQLMRALHDIAPVVVVPGSQDRGAWWDSHDVYGGTGVVELRGAATERTIRSVQLYIWGQDYFPPQLLPREPPPPPGAVTILLQHGPDLMAEAVHAHFDLYLAGHTHGGQIALPFYGALFTNSRYDKQYESGVFHEGSTTLYVNRGIGFAKWPQPEARFLARPEVTVIDLVSRP